jgi:excisionase family DNA binding protein
MSPDEQISVQQAATMAATSPTTIKRKIASGEIRATKNGRGQHVIHKEDLMAYLSTQERPGGRQGATAVRPDPGHGLSTSTEATLIGILEKDLADTKGRLAATEERLRTADARLERAEARNEKLQAELLSLMHELKAALTGKQSGKGLSAWFNRVLEK